MWKCKFCGIELSEASMIASRYDAGYCDCCRAIDLSTNYDYWRRVVYEEALFRRLDGRE